MTAHWSLKRLGDIFEIARGGSPRPIEKFITDDPAGLSWIKIGDASASGKFIEKTKDKIKREGLSKSRYVEPGDFLLTNSMSFGRPYIMATDGCIHDGWLVLKPRTKELVHPDYFYYLLGSGAVYRQFASRAGGSTVKNLNTDIVSSIEIRLPPLHEQVRIAAILDKADALRRKRKRAIHLLDSLTQSIFVEMFGDPKDNQKRWPLLAFGESCQDKTSASGKIQRVAYGDAGLYPVVDQGQEFIAGWTDDEDQVTFVKKPIVVFGDHTRAVKYVDFDFVVGADGAKVLCPSPQFNPRFFAELLRLMPIPDLGYSRHMRALKELKFACPPLRMQDAFAERLKLSQKHRVSFYAAREDLTSLFSSLQSRAFAGEL